MKRAPVGNPKPSLIGAAEGVTPVLDEIAEDRKGSSHRDLLGLLGFPVHPMTSSPAAVSSRAKRTPTPPAAPVWNTFTR
jgi:hypothetical protein